MSRPLLLDAYACAGLAGDGYSEAGFDVVALDNDPRALKHNPHPTVLGDALVLLADRGFMRQFDAVHASPPCQIHSATRRLADAQGRGAGRAVDLLPQTIALLSALDVPWVVENVERSPVRAMPGAVRLCGSSFGLQVQRHRWLAPSPGLLLSGSACAHDRFPADPITGKPRPLGVYYAKGDSIPSGGRTALDDDHAHAVMGVSHRRLPWRYLCEGLPTQYTAHVGGCVQRALRVAA